MGLTTEEVLRQSEGAMKQWSETWKTNAKVNGEILKDRGYSNQRIFGHGIGKKLVCVAFGAELEKQVEHLKIKNEAVDIACVDKAMSYLLDNGIKPDFVSLADAGIDYEKWCAPYIDQTEDIALLMNVTANPKWAENWKGKVFYFVNQDNIKTEDIFAPLSGCNELVKASSNVGNSVLVHAETYMMYDSYYLIGYDYHWTEGNYYCNNDSDKRWYMNHFQVLLPNGKLVSTSQNLLFSARWLMDFIKAIIVPHKKKIFTCSDSLLELPSAKLERVMKETTQRTLNPKEIDFVVQNRSQNIRISPDDGGEKLKEVLQSHQVVDVVVRHLPKDLFQEVA